MSGSFFVRFQHLTDFRTTRTPLLAAVIVLFTLPIVGCASSASVSALATSLGKALAKPHISQSTTHLLSCLFDRFVRALNTSCLRIRIHVKVPVQWWQTFTRGEMQPQRYETYITPHDEAKYWRVADRYRRRLYSGNGARSSSLSSSSEEEASMPVPLVTYYTPRLLPLYRRDGKRKSRDVDIDARECWIPPRTFCKWHRMVFPEARHPTLAQAAARIRYYSNRDLREIQRISRLVPDEQVFRPKDKRTRKVKPTTRYSDMWKAWLESKGADIVIVFECLL